MARWPGRTSGPNPRRLAHAVLTLALKHAVRQGLLSATCGDAVEAPTVTKATIQPLDQTEVAKLLKAAEGDRLEALYHLAIGSGMRQGELFGLHWSDVDLGRRHGIGPPVVGRSLRPVGPRRTQSASSRRLIDLPAHAVTALRRAPQAGHGRGQGRVEFVFCNQSGGPMRRSHFHHDDYKPLLKRAKIRAARFHDLRHTHATLCLLAGKTRR